MDSPGKNVKADPARTEETIESPGIEGDKLDKPSRAEISFPVVGKDMMNDKVTQICTRSRAVRYARRNEAQIINSKSERSCTLIPNKRAVSEKVKEVPLRKDVENITAQNNRLNHELESATNHIYERRRKDSAKNNRQNRKKILSQRKITEKLKKRSSCKKSISGQETGGQQLRADGGFYRAESATPNLLDIALSRTKAAVTWFQKLFREHGIISRYPNLPHSEFSFPRSDHISYWVRSLVFEICFKGFENESFNTLGGISRCLDTGIRQTKFYEYYLSELAKNNADDIDDPQFEEFYKTKSCLLKRILAGNEGSLNISNIEELGGPQLALSFRAAARSVWLLHKLAFSFEPPASIFRVERGADVDPNYMEAVVDLDDSEQYIPKVGFMIAPGLRLSETVMRCEVYLSIKCSASPHSES